MPMISRTIRLAASRKIHTPTLVVTPVNTEVVEEEGVGVPDGTGDGEIEGSGETDGVGLAEGSGVADGVGLGEAEGRGSSSFSTIRSVLTPSFDPWRTVILASRLPFDPLTTVTCSA